MTYHHQISRQLEFDVFHYLRTGYVPCSSHKVYVRIDALFTRKMLKIIMNDKLPHGSCYSVNHFIFDDVDTCIDCLVNMYKTLQKETKYTSYATSYITLFAARMKKDV